VPAAADARAAATMAAAERTESAAAATARASSSKPAPRRSERKYTEADVRECLHVMRAQVMAMGEAESAYSVAKDAGWPGMRAVVRTPFPPAASLARVSR